MTTLKDRAFDFEKQPEVLFQIQARDLVNHSAIAYLTVHVLDVNDEDPRITVVRFLLFKEICLVPKI